MKTNLRKNPIDFMMGADPEVFLTYRGAAAPFHGNAAGKFGLDGNGRTCELRVDPSPSPLQLVANIHSILKNQVKSFPQTLAYDWHAGSSVLNYAIGGHVHFGVAKYNINYDMTNEVISNYVGSIALVLEDIRGAKHRRQVKEYGGYLDWRPQNHGFEHRSLSSWITNPAVAAGILCLSKVVMYELLNNKSFTPVYHFNEDTFKNVNRQIILDKFPTIWKEIQGMILYPKYKKFIDVLHFLVTKNMTWFPKKKTFKETWGLVDFTVPPPEKQKIDLSAVWKPFLIN